MLRSINFNVQGGGIMSGAPLSRPSGRQWFTVAGRLLAGWTCLFVGIAACPCGPVHSNDAADAMQALGLEDGLFFPLTAFVVETLRPSCPAAGAEVPISLPGYLDTWGVPGPRWLPGPAGRRNYKEAPHLRRRDLVLATEGRPSPGRCLQVL